MARSSRRRRRKSETAKLFIGVAFIGFALLCAFGLGYAYFIIPRAPMLDKTRLCPVDGPKSGTVILVDASDDLSNVTKQEVLKLLMDVAEALPPYGLLDVRALNPVANNHRRPTMS